MPVRGWSRSPTTTLRYDCNSPWSCVDTPSPQPAARATPRHVDAPVQRGLLHLLYRGELPVRQTSRAHTASAAPRWPCRVALRAGRIDQHPVMAGQLGIRPVDIGVVQVGPVHPSARAVGHQSPGHPMAIGLPSTSSRMMHSSSRRGSRPRSTGPAEVARRAMPTRSIRVASDRGAGRICLQNRA